MDAKKLEFYKALLLKTKEQILNSSSFKGTQDLEVPPEDLADDADLAANVVNQQITLNLREKEVNKIRSIDFALMRIEDGTYGYCEDCGEEIGAKRLEYQPWADLCIVHAEEQEKAYRRKA